MLFTDFREVSTCEGSTFRKCPDNVRKAVTVAAIRQSIDKLFRSRTLGQPIIKGWFVPQRLLIVFADLTTQSEGAVLGAFLLCCSFECPPVHRIFQKRVELRVEVVARQVDVLPGSRVFLYKTGLECLPMAWLVSQDLLEHLRSERGRKADLCGRHSDITMGLCLDK